jgi:hypothetical protein
VVAGALVAASAVHAGRLSGLVALVGLAGWALLALGLVLRSPAPLAPGLFLLGVEYAVALLLRGGALDPLAPVVAGALFLVSELAFWSVGPGAVPDEQPVVVRRLVTVALSGLVAGGIGAVLVAASDFAFSGGLVLEAAGVTAAVLAVALVGVAARSDQLS